jgi:NTP pyrophosphatase (non-canonical NTP hydrolase)
MKTKADHLLACIGEECGEIQQVVGKALRFGLFDTNPKTKKTNWLELRKELHDLIAVYRMLADEVDRFGSLETKLFEKKAKRVLKYMEYAMEVGELEKT